MAICPVRFFAKIRTVKRVRPAGHFPGDKRYGEKYRKAMSARQASAVTVERNLQAKAAERRHLRAGFQSATASRGAVSLTCVFALCENAGAVGSCLANRAVLAAAGLPSRGGTHMLLRDFSCMGQLPTKFAACGFVQDQSLAG